MKALTSVHTPFVAMLGGNPPCNAVASEIERLYGALDAVRWADNPGTVRLLASGLRRKPQRDVSAPFGPPPH